jgi:hypothetical protein
MLVKLGGLLAEARGSVGGSTFARNRYGAYVRNRTKPVDPGSAAQVLQRGRMSASVTNWRALTAAQRDTWNAKALDTHLVNRLGEPFHPTGMNLFTRSDNLLALAGLTGVTDPPSSPIIEDFGSFASYTGASGLEHNSTTASWPTAAVMLLWFQLDLTNSTYYYKGPYANFQTAVLADYTADVIILEADATVATDTAQGVSWRLVSTTGAASAIGRMRTFKP